MPDQMGVSQPAGRLRLGVNIDHVATIRNARGGSHSELDALEMDQYSELQEAASILREGVEDLADLVVGQAAVARQHERGDAGEQQRGGRPEASAAGGHGEGHGHGQKRAAEGRQGQDVEAPAAVAGAAPENRNHVRGSADAVDVCRDAATAWFAPFPPKA